MAGTKVFFASDFHLGTPDRESSKEREKIILQWLDHIAPEANRIYLVGDLFDFWFEYRSVVPRGFVRFLGKLAELRDGGIDLQVFSGNHDMWLKKYFPEELGIPVYHQPITTRIGMHTFFIGHGDGLGPSDHGYKFIKHVFANPVCQWLFARLHPNFAFFLADFWSSKSRSHRDDVEFLGRDKEWLISYCESILQTNPADFYLFGHRHLPIDFLLSNGRSRYLNLGDWINYRSYAEYDGQELTVQFYRQTRGVIHGKELAS